MPTRDVYRGASARVSQQQSLLLPRAMQGPWVGRQLQRQPCGPTLQGALTKRLTGHTCSKHGQHGTVKPRERTMYT